MIINTAVISGNLVSDPIVRETPQGKKVVNFSIAAERQYKGEKEVSFFDIEVWGKMGEICEEFLVKGREVIVEGRLRQSRWETGDGSKRSQVKIVANFVKFLGGKKTSALTPKEQQIVEGIEEGLSAEANNQA
ncbi:MAG: single-stranded DNA-binding protein [Candidatus Omnitrophica bacterium]|nr:single-stranded DNA-binding protein [Candidatus Omnitrophota bacterium]